MTSLDFFTKALPSKQFHAMRDQIMNVPGLHALPGVPDCAACGGTGMVKGRPCYVCDITAEHANAPASSNGGALNAEGSTPLSGSV